MKQDVFKKKSLITWEIPHYATKRKAHLMILMTMTTTLIELNKAVGTLFLRPSLSLSKILKNRAQDIYNSHSGNSSNTQFTIYFFQLRCLLITIPIML